jgi:YidC/Oxa1 family membrane protein insertase
MAIILLGASLYSKWEIQHQPDQNNTSKVQDTAKNNTSDLGKNNVITKPTNAVNNQKSTIKTATNNLITVNTDLYIIKISPEDGSIVDTYLKDYNTSLKDSSPLELLKNGSYIATNGFLSKQLGKQKLIFTSSKSDYELGSNSDINVTLHANSNGLNITKTYSFKKDSYTIKVDQTIENNDSDPVNGYFFGRIIRAGTGGESGSIFDVHSYSTYTGTVLSSTEDHYQKESPSDIKDAKNGSIQITTDQGWAAMVEHYFIAAWAPINPEKQDFTLFSTTGSNSYSTGAYSPEVSIKPGNSVTNTANLYIGPTIKEQLDQAAPNLSLTIDYGWLWFISEIIFWAMSIIYGFVGNWGVAIILVTCLIKLIFFPLSAKSYRSMGRMRLLQPRIKQLKEQFGDDKQGMTKAMMGLYKTEKVNPLGGCLPLVVQIPVFIALYWVLLESVQLRQAPFIFWIHDLAAKDPYYVLPILMGLSMFIQQRLNPAPPDPMQAKIMMFMPVVFTFMFLNFPSGLVLYWLVNNVLSILQQWYIMKNIEKSSKKRKT